MPRNGSGTYTLPAGNPVVTGTTISSTTHNATLADIVTALTNSLAKDGQTTPTADLPMGNNRLTGLKLATALTDAARVDQVQNGAYTLLGTVAGTNTITAVAAPVPAAYASGQTFLLIPAVTNTGATTLNVSSLGAKNVFANGAACAGGELIASIPYLVEYDGTQFNILGRSRAPTKQAFTSSGTYTKPAGLVAALAMCKGGGGGGGGSSVGGRGGGGGEGETTWRLLAASSIGATESVTIGAGGAAVSANTALPGGTGGTTSVGSLLTAIGGTGGTAGNSGGAGGSGGSGGTSANWAEAGAAGHAGADTTGATGINAAGGGRGGGASGSGGNVGGGGGSGGTGAGSGAGGSGLVVVIEYY